MGEGLGVRVREVAIGDFLNPHNFVETFAAAHHASQTAGTSLRRDWKQKGGYTSGTKCKEESFAPPSLLGYALLTSFVTILKAL